MDDEGVDVAISELAEKVEILADRMFSFDDYDIEARDGIAIHSVGEAVAELARSARRIADAIMPNIPGAKNQYGGHVESLTESVMGVTQGLGDIAAAIRELAEAVREHGSK